MTELTDRALLDLVQAGNEQAIEVIFDRHSAVIYSVALRVLRDPLEAERILEEVLMTVWRVPTDVFTTGLSLQQWTALEARRLAVQTRRRYSPEVACDKLMGASKTDARTLLTLAFFEGKTLPQICVLTGISLNVAKEGLTASIVEFRAAGSSQPTAQTKIKVPTSTVVNRARLLESDPKKTAHKGEAASTGATTAPAGAYRKHDVSLPNARQNISTR